MLDHVAHAAGHWQDLWRRYAVDLGAEWVSGGTNRGFAPGQLRFRNGARLEMLMPWDVHVDDFLARFLDRSGPGAHHLTFKVADLGAALDEARQAGFEPIGIDLSNPGWMEAFIHPKQATGVVVQLAESSEPPNDRSLRGRARRRRGFPTTDVPSMTDPGMRQEPTSSGSCMPSPTPPSPARCSSTSCTGRWSTRDRQASHGWTTLSWGGPLGIRLVWPVEAATGNEAADGLTEWLSGRPGRVHHLELRVDEPAAVPGALPATDSSCHPQDGAGSDWWEVPAADNAGLRLGNAGHRVIDRRRVVPPGRRLDDR